MPDRPPAESVPTPVGAPFALPARVTHPVAVAVLAQCGQALAQGSRRFGLAACVDFDSSLIGILLELLRLAGQAGTPIALTEPPPNLRKLAELYGVHGLLFPTPEPA